MARGGGRGASAVGGGWPGDDGGWVVVDKPGGLLSVPGRPPNDGDSVVSRVRGMVAGASGPIAVHRLDMETSGLMVCALDAWTHRELSVRFERRAVRKVYEAWVAGWLSAEEGVIRLPMRPEPRARPMQVVDRERGKPAETRFRVVAREVCVGGGEGGEVTRVVFEPVTGRSHQLRVHAAHPEGLGAPIVGDGLYPPRRERWSAEAWSALCERWEPVRCTAGMPGAGLLLRATVLGFEDPWTGEWVEVRGGRGGGGTGGEATPAEERRSKGATKRRSDEAKKRRSDGATK